MATTHEQEVVEEYWREVESLGISDLVRMADGPDFVGRRPDGAYIRVPSPDRRHARNLPLALAVLTAHCRKWHN